ncbi:MAG TPA: WhiB family transcriptional regulator [Candidatus Saccharimonadales bacterium]|jgi:WhiB family redox-sensing transcriptional regulator|nr:WhiB family transcriptional regulator [Candidatus Saccharimonadales bacterium]
MSPERTENSAQIVSDTRAGYIGQVLSLKETPGWRQKAACKGLDPEIFYPRKDSENDMALSVCEDCHVWVDCLRFAIKYHQDQGVWGGCTETQRARMIKKFKIH